MSWLRGIGGLTISLVVLMGHGKAHAQRDELPRGALLRLGTDQLRHGGGVSSLAFSPDSKYLLSGGSEWTARLWDVSTGKQVQEFSGSQAPTWAVAFAPDGKTILTGTSESMIRFWDVATGRQTRFMETTPGGMGLLAISPDGKVIASAGPLRLWDVAKGELLRNLRGPESGLTSLVFSPDSQSVVLTAYNLPAQMYEVATGKLVRSFQGNLGDITGAAFTPDGKMLVTGAVQSATVWETDTGKAVRHFASLPSSPSSVAVSPDGKLVGTAGYDDVIRLWNLATGQEVRACAGTVKHARRLTFSPDGKLLAADSGHAIRLWDVATGKEVGPSGGHYGLVEHVAVSADGKLIASVETASYVVHIWDRFTGRELRQFRVGSRFPIHSIAFAPAGRALAVSADRAVRLWDADSGKELRTFREERASCILGFAADGKTLASGCLDGSILLWEPDSGETIARLKGTAQNLRSVSLSADGKFMAVGGLNSEVYLWDVDARKELRVLNRHTASVMGVGIAPDGRSVASVALDGMVRIWDAAGKERWVCDCRQELFRATALAISPDGRLLASAGGSCTIHIWEAATGKEVAEFKGHRAGILTLAFTPDGRALVSGGADTSVLVWDITGRLDGDRLRPIKLNVKELEAQWADLAGAESRTAYEAVWKLAAAPEQTVPFLQRHLRPVEATLSAERFARLLRDLDDDNFKVRETAFKELQKLGPQIEPELRKTLAEKHPVEVQLRLEQLLAKLADPSASPERMRWLRATHVLEQAGTPEARQLLEKLAGGAAGAVETEDARRTLKRLGKR